MAKNDINFDEIFPSMGLDSLTETEKTLIRRYITSMGNTVRWRNYPHLLDSAPIIDEQMSIYCSFFILKYLLKNNRENEKIIEQNNQIIKLLQKIADK